MPLLIIRALLDIPQSLLLGGVGFQRAASIATAVVLVFGRGRRPLDLASSSLGVLLGTTA